MPEIFNEHYDPVATAERILEQHADSVAPAEMLALEHDLNSDLEADVAAMKVDLGPLFDGTWKHGVLARVISVLKF